jgi:hypothetical protein
MAKCVLLLLTTYNSALKVLYIEQLGLPAWIRTLTSAEFCR